MNPPEGEVEPLRLEAEGPAGSIDGFFLASAVTSGPTPSPAMVAILNDRRSSSLPPFQLPPYEGDELWAATISSMKGGKGEK